MPSKLMLEEVFVTEGVPEFTFVPPPNFNEILLDVRRPGKPALHIHIVVGTRDGSAKAGHLGEGHVRPTLEVVVTESPAHLRKVRDTETGLALIRPAA